MIETERLRLRLVDECDAGRLLDYYSRNRDHLDPWDPPRPEGFFQADYWPAELDRLREAIAAGRTQPFLVFRRGDPEHLVGRCTLSNIVRGPFQAAYLGYGLDHRHQGQGLMTEALHGLVNYAFGTLGLHRIMANATPENLRSLRVLERLGFVREGLARDYLFINGEWRDHVLTSLTNQAWRPPD